jgi:hypothetical protein
MDGEYLVVDEVVWTRRNARPEAKCLCCIYISRTCMAQEILAFSIITLSLDCSVLFEKMIACIGKPAIQSRL